MHIVNNRGIEWLKRRLSSKLYMDQCVKTTVVPRRHKICEDVKGVGQGWCFYHVLFNVCNEYLTKEAIYGVGDFKTGRRLIRALKYTNDLALYYSARLMC
jgi:hypothetical protein